MTQDLEDAKELNSFVLFSSVSSLLGLPGAQHAKMAPAPRSQGVTYSASNAYLDGLSLWRRSEGLPCSSLQWGPVADVGMAAKGEAHGAAEAWPVSYSLRV